MDNRETFTLSEIEQAFIEAGLLGNFQDLATILLKIIEVRNTIEMEEASKIEVYEIHPALNLQSTLEDTIRKIFKSADIDDAFRGDDDEIPDGGASCIQYIRIGVNLYEVSLHCEADWCGDWSVRANLVGDISVTNIKEIKSFEVIEDHGDYQFIKIK